MATAAGRRREEAREFWSAAVRLWEGSGLSVRDFCRREGVGEHSFYAWRARLRAEGRLEKGTFRFPAATDPQSVSVEVSAQELSLLLWGIDPESVKRQKRYVHAG